MDQMRSCWFQVPLQSIWFLYKKSKPELLDINVFELSLAINGEVRNEIENMLERGWGGGWRFPCERGGDRRRLLGV